MEKVERERLRTEFEFAKSLAGGERLSVSISEGLALIADSERCERLEGLDWEAILYGLSDWQNHASNDATFEARQRIIDSITSALEVSDGE